MTPNSEGIRSRLHPAASQWTADTWYTATVAAL